MTQQTGPRLDREQTRQVVAMATLLGRQHLTDPEEVAGRG